jgi:hypothetical protein
MKNQVKEKEIEVNSIKEELKSVEKFIKEKEKTEKLIANLIYNINGLKEDLERKTKKLRDFERKILENKMPTENSILNNSGSKGNHSENSLEKLRDKIIKSLGDENIKLKEKLRNFNNNNDNNLIKNENDIELNIEGIN